MNEVVAARQVPWDAVYPRMIVDYCCSRGVARAELLAACDLSAALLDEPGSHIDWPSYARLVAAAAERLHEPALGLVAGQQFTLGAHGYVGYAAMSSPTVGDAIRVGVRYSKTRSGPVTVRCLQEQDCALLTAELDTPQDAFYHYVMEFTAATVLSALRFYLGGQLPDVVVELRYPAPPHAARYSELLAVPVRFGKPRNCVRLPAAVLAQPLASANPALSRLAEQQCAALMAALRRRRRQDDLPARIQQILVRQVGHFPTQEEVARQLRLSPRTLRLHLLRHLTSYQKILTQTRHDLALHYLQTTPLTIEDIASLLNYRDTASFARAFKSWTGESPGAYRAAVRRDRQAAAGLIAS